MKKQIMLVTLTLLGIGITSLVNAAYIFTDLGTLGGNNSTATAINNAGQVAGFSYTTLDDSHATLWNGTTLTALDTMGGYYSQATAINNAGQIVGHVNMSSTSNDWYGTVWNGASLTGNRILGTNHDDAYAINDAGQVAGSNAYHATIWNGTTATVLGNGTVLAINNNGQAAGAAMYSGGFEHATVWDGVTATDLGTLGGSSSQAEGINDAGIIAGYSWIIGNAATHATIWNGTTITDLGTLGGNISQARAINNVGQVVGDAATLDHFQHATLWNGTTAIDLNNFMDAASICAGWVLATANDINDNGWIVGIALNKLTGVRHGYLLSDTIAAVPEPSTYTMMLAGLCLLSFSARRRKQLAAA